MLKHNPLFRDQGEDHHSDFIDDDDTHGFDDDGHDDHDRLGHSPVIYEDTNYDHKFAAQELAAHTSANLINIDPQALNIVQQNPELALSAAYGGAKEVYDLSHKREASGQLSRAEELRLTRLNGTLQLLYDNFMIRTPVTEEGHTDYIGIIGQDGEERLGHALEVQTEKVARAFEKEHMLEYPLEPDEPAVVLEALGQLCAQELARVKASSKAPEPKIIAGEDAVSEDRAALPAPDAGRGRGGSKKDPK